MSAASSPRGHTKAKGPRSASKEAPPDGGTEDANPESTQATRLANLAQDAYRFVRTQDGEVYAVAKAGPNVAITVGRGGQFGNHLVRLFLEKEHGAPSDNAEKMAIKIMHAYAYDQDPERVHIRVARHADVARHEHGIVLDLGTPDGSCVIVTAKGWRVERKSPVVFRRGVVLPLPEPVHGADGLQCLADLVNASEAQLRLGIAWLVASLIPDIPHPILIPRGEQGSAKTSVARIFQSLVDPSGATPGALPRTEDAFAVRMNAAYVQAFDNASIIPPWLSDSLCRAVTGAADTKRTLYADRDLTIIQYQRPVILTTIHAGQLAGDLVERSLPLDLDRITGEKRKTERSAIGQDVNEKPGLFDLLDQARPAILGAILDLVASVFRSIPAVSVDRLPRMADFGMILAALDHAQGWETFQLYSELVDSETGSLLEGDVFAPRLVKFMDDLSEWSGTATELLDKLTERLKDPDHPPKGWPADATRASGHIKRLAPALRVHNIEVEQCRATDKGRSRIWIVRNLASAASAATGEPADLRKRPDATADANGWADASQRPERTLRTLADASDLASVRSVSAGHAAQNGFADAADAVFSKQEKNEPEYCRACGNLLDPVLAAMGETEHPLCALAEAEPSRGHQAGAA